MPRCFNNSWKPGYITDVSKLEKKYFSGLLPLGVDAGEALDALFEKYGYEMIHRVYLVKNPTQNRELLLITTIFYYPN